ncbi:MAG: hypothetical protein NT062_33245, partial [Proteobacteria bacterium]|nr:hypothetical protein [Pseudomonadota bacterium]
SGSGSGSDVIATGSAGSGSGSAGTTNEPAVDGAPTTAGTAANLLAYFPTGHVVTALIRFDRLRDTEWAATTERLLRPMPDYQVLFGTTDAKITDKLDTLVISSPTPKDASATTLVAHVSMGRAGLRAFLDAANPIAWASATGGLYGKRTGRTYKADKRVFLSPFRGWFLLGQPADLPGLTTPKKGDLDTVEASVKLPAWLAGIRKIEEESGGDKRGPALVLTLAFDGKKIDLQGNDFGLGVSVVQTPTRVSLAMEIVKQGWVIRGNISFKTDAEATGFLASITTVKERIADSRALQMVVGKPIVHLLENLSFQRTGARLSYATSLSIADARALLAVAAQQLDAYFKP